MGAVGGRRDTGMRDGAQRGRDPDEAARPGAPRPGLERRPDRQETAGAIELQGGRARRRSRGRVDYVLRVKTAPDSQPVAVALIEAKAEDLPAAHGLEQGKLYAVTRRLNVPFVFASNGHRVVEFDRTAGITGPTKPLAEFPTPDDLLRRYEEAFGVRLDDTAASRGALG